MTLRRGFLFMLSFLVVSNSSFAQTSQPANDPVRFELPTVIVAVEKRPQDVLNVPVSVTTVQRETLQNAGMRYVNDAARLAPNVFLHEFSARKLSNPRFRGIGSGPNNPGVTTYIDGVPQLNANSSSLELIDVNQIEFARGPQSALFGRNTVGGLIKIASREPSRTAWTGDVDGAVREPATFATFAGRYQDRWSGDRVSVGVAAGYSARDGYTVNDLTGNTLDDRSAAFGKVQLLFTPAASWDARVDRQRGARPRRRLRPPGPGGAAPESVSCVAQLRRLYPPRCGRADVPADASRHARLTSRAPPGSSAGRRAIRPISTTVRCR